MLDQIDRFVLGITELVKRDRRCGSFQDESTLGGNMMMAVRKSNVNKNSYCFFLFHNHKENNN